MTAADFAGPRQGADLRPAGRLTLIATVATAHLAALVALDIPVAPPPPLLSLIQIEAITEPDIADPMPASAPSEGGEAAAPQTPVDDGSTLEPPPQVVQGAPQPTELPQDTAPADPEPPAPALASAQPPSDPPRDAEQVSPVVVEPQSPYAVTPAQIPLAQRPAPPRREPAKLKPERAAAKRARPVASAPSVARGARRESPDGPRAAAQGRAARHGRDGAGGSAGSGGSGLVHSAYAGLVLSQIQARKFYPSAARASGAVGVVGFAFAIGPSGATSRFSVTRSSGSSALDQAARQIVMSLRLPPPPGGSFAASSSLNFRLSR